jgi:hypothetical protein
MVTKSQTSTQTQAAVFWTPSAKRLRVRFQKALRPNNLSECL